MRAAVVPFDRTPLTALFQINFPRHSYESEEAVKLLEMPLPNLVAQLRANAHLARKAAAAQLSASRGSALSTEEGEEYAITAPRARNSRHCSEQKSKAARRCASARRQWRLRHQALPPGAGKARRTYLMPSRAPSS